jgi:hypothetical protein
MEHTTLQEAENFSPVNGHRHAVDRNRVAEALHEAVQGNERLGHG